MAWKGGANAAEGRQAADTRERVRVKIRAIAPRSSAHPETLGANTALRPQKAAAQNASADRICTDDFLGRAVRLGRAVLRLAQSRPDR
jgi:hypothetical protein